MEVSLGQGMCLSNSVFRIGWSEVSVTVNVRRYDEGLDDDLNEWGTSCILRVQRCQRCNSRLNKNEPKGSYGFFPPTSWVVKDSNRLRTQRPQSLLHRRRFSGRDWEAQVQSTKRKWRVVWHGRGIDDFDEGLESQDDLIVGILKSLTGRISDVIEDTDRYWILWQSRLIYITYLLSFKVKTRIYINRVSQYNVPLSPV